MIFNRAIFLILVFKLYILTYVTKSIFLKNIWMREKGTILRKLYDWIYIYFVIHEEMSNSNIICNKNIIWALHKYKFVEKWTRIEIFGLHLVLFSQKDHCISRRLYMMTQSKKL